MNKCGNSFCLSESQHGKAGITPNPDDRIGAEVFHNRANLEKTLYQFKWQRNIFYQRTSIKPCYIQPFDFISSLRYLFHLHFSFSPNKQDLNTGINFFQCVCECNSRKNMPSCSASCYYNS